MSEQTQQSTREQSRHLREQPPIASRPPGDHRTGRREVELYVRTYTTLLQSSGAVGVSSLEPAHYTADSSLHAGAEEPKPDLNAFLYSANRIPACIVEIQHIVLGQTRHAFVRAGYDQLDSWELAWAPGRRRRWHWNGKDILAAYIASASDLDDLIPSIVAYQIEWNKMHHLLRAVPEAQDLIERAGDGEDLDAAHLTVVMEALLLDDSDWARLGGVWGDRFWANLVAVATVRKRMDLRMLGGTYLGYGRSVRSWWRPVAHVATEQVLRDRPIYFVSSNTHSIANTLSGVAIRRHDELTAFIRETNHSEMLPELEKIEAGEQRASLENLLYFAARPYFYGPDRSAARAEREAEERAIGIVHLDPTGAVDVGVQIIDLSRLDPARFDSRLAGFDPRESDAVIININYPLGMAAYHIMSQIGIATDQLRGVYVLGKAATLNGRIGDIMLSDVVYDEHSGNTYWFDNCFGYESVAPYLIFGAALDNQKAVTVKGTFLQNEGYLDFYYRENYTVVEMEAGPYLSALYEDVFLERHPTSDAINLAPLSGHLDLGVIHYASDTPYTRAHTLGARGMSFYGMDSTYASTIAILQRIFSLARERVSNGG
ncbi:MAG: hypothetical protein H0V37_14820 [Chloroflexia bacterium]|nr:hypothetical protein [Chloroflexia bacterium]